MASFRCCRCNECCKLLGLDKTHASENVDASGNFSIQVLDEALPLEAAGLAVRRNVKNPAGYGTYDVYQLSSQGSQTLLRERRVGTPRKAKRAARRPASPGGSGAHLGGERRRRNDTARQEKTPREACPW